MAYSCNSVSVDSESITAFAMKALGIEPMTTASGFDEVPGGDFSTIDMSNSDGVPVVGPTRGEGDCSGSGEEVGQPLRG